jgi:hypothetical protein
MRTNRRTDERDPEIPRYVAQEIRSFVDDRQVCVDRLLRYAKNWFTVHLNELRSGIYRYASTEQRTNLTKSRDATAALVRQKLSRKRGIFYEDIRCP